MRGASSRRCFQSAFFVAGILSLIAAAVTALADWALDVVGLHRLELYHATANEASCRVALKTGFAPEGTKRSAVLHEDGWHDMHLHARIKGDGAGAAR